MAIEIVTITHFIKNPKTKRPRVLWVIKSGLRVLGVEHSATEAIHKVEQEGWILQSGNYEYRPSETDFSYFI